MRVVYWFAGMHSEPQEPAGARRAAARPRASRRRVAWRACAALLVCGGALRAELLLQDDFSQKNPAGDRTDDTGLLAAFLQDVTSGATLSLVDDSAPGGLGSADVLDVDVLAAYRGVTAVLDVVGPEYDAGALDVIGNSLELRFRWRATAAAASTALRFGVLNNGGDQQLADSSATGNSTNTVGFGVSLPHGGGTGGSFLLDTNDGVGGTIMLGGTGLTTLGTFTAAPIADTTPHEAVFRVTRTETGYTLKLEVDGGATQSLATTQTPVTAFHQIGWNTTNPGTDFRLDNVELDLNTLRNGTFERGALQADGTFNAFSRHWTPSPAGAAKAHTGLTAGSHTAAYFDTDVTGNRGQLSQTPEAAGRDWVFSVDFATEDGGGATARGFNVRLLNAGGMINLRVNGDGRLEVFNGVVGSGGAWQSLAALGTVAFSNDADGDDSFAGPGDTLEVYHLTIQGHDYGLPEARYDILLHPIGDPGAGLGLEGLTYWQDTGATDPGVTGVSGLLFVSSSSAGDFAVDNASVVLVPEPRMAWLLLAASVAAAAARVRRRR